MSKSERVVIFPPSNINKRTNLGKIKWKEALEVFSKSLMNFQKNSSLDKITSRGWCYIIETSGFIRKDQFDLCQDVINECRDKGILPINFVALDLNREFFYIDHINYSIPKEHIVDWLYSAKDSEQYKEDFEFWESQSCYIQCMVEKIDVLNLFKPICEKYHIPMANGKGWSDKNSRWQLSQRYKYWESRGKKCILLYIRDFDPVGLLIGSKMKKNIADLINCIDLKGRTGWNPENLIVDPFLLSYEFIQENNLLWIENLISGSGKPPNKKLQYIKDYIAKYGERKVEANALIVVEEESRELFESTILNYLGDNPFEIYDRAIKEDQEKTVKVMEKINLKERIQELIDEIEELEDGE